MKTKDWCLAALAGALLLLAACTGATGAVENSRPIVRSTPATAATAATAVAGETLAGLSTVEQLAQITPPLRDLRRLVQQLNGPATAAPLTVAGAPPAYAIDDQESFSVRNTSTNRVTEISATLVYSTPVAYIWVQSDQEFDRAGLQRSADRFSSITYPNVVNAFGSEWRPGVDNDERLHILYNVAMGDGVSGYFSGSDEYTRAVLPFSNQKEMFYINLLAINRSQNYAALDTTLAHELQHMIHWHMDRGEELWINEGLSEYAQQVAEFAVGGAFTAAFTADPDLQLTSWGTVNGNRPHYGAAYLFIVYLAQQFGPPAIANLVADPDNGMSSVTNALASVGAELDGEQLFADWVAANYADQALAEDGRYGYQELDPPAPAVAAQHVQFPVAPQQGTVGNFATDYIELAGVGDVVFTFAGATATALAAAELAAGERAWWANRADDADARLLARYDLSGLAAQTPLTLTASMWWDIESDYDFGYVMASSDGEYWRLLPGAHMSSDNASGNAFGPAYTGHSGDSPDSAAWVEESFDLSAYAGGPLSLRFSYITDDALNQAGWLMKDVQLTGPAGVIAPLGADGLRADDLGADDLGADDLGAGWQSEGWLLTDNRLPQRWLLQVLEFDGDTLTAVRRVPSDAQGRAEAEIAGLGNGRRAVVAISGLSPVTTLPAQYEYTITSKN